MTTTLADQVRASTPVDCRSADRHPAAQAPASKTRAHVTTRPSIASKDAWSDRTANGRPGASPASCASARAAARPHRFPAVRIHGRHARRRPTIAVTSTAASGLPASAPDRAMCRRCRSRTTATSPAPWYSRVCIVVPEAQNFATIRDARRQGQDRACPALFPEDADEDEGDPARYADRATRRWLLVSAVRKRCWWSRTPRRRTPAKSS